jgi:hypothetical protein
MDDLAELATELRHHGISLTLDFVFNHTSDEHEWAQAAPAPASALPGLLSAVSRPHLPDLYEKTMPEVFGEDHPGAFTYRTRMKRWVWTTFHTYQWDLNYENPEVFNRMMEEMLFLANQGVEILRLDAVAFLWKRLGTNSQNLPEAHWIIQAFNALASIAAPAMVFKSEAIVHPDEVREYISVDECPLSYNPQLMALLWDALATRDVRVLHRAMSQSLRAALGLRLGQLSCAATTTSAGPSPTTTWRRSGSTPTPPPLPDPLLHRPLRGQLRPRRAVPGGPGDRRRPRLRHLCLADRRRDAPRRGDAASWSWPSAASC